MKFPFPLLCAMPNSDDFDGLADDPIDHHIRPNSGKLSSILDQPGSAAVWECL